MNYPMLTHLVTHLVGVTTTTYIVLKFAAINPQTIVLLGQVIVNTKHRVAFGLDFYVVLSTYISDNKFKQTPK